VGSCTYFPDEKRAARADLSSEMCNAREALSRLVMVGEDGSERRLSRQQQEGYVSVLFSPVALPGNEGCKVTYYRIRKDLGLPPTTTFKGVEPDKERSAEPSIPKAWRCMRGHDVPSKLLERMLGNRGLADAIGEALTYASTEESLKKQIEPLDLSAEEASALSRLPFAGRIFKGYGSRSLKALHMLVDAFGEPGVTSLTEAERQANQASGVEGSAFSLKLRYVLRELNTDTGYYDATGEVVERQYCFYENLSQGTMQIHTTVNGVGDFYITASRATKILNDVMRLYDPSDPIDYGSLS
jgi:CRISPR-associated endonuclease Csn1